MISRLLLRASPARFKICKNAYLVIVIVAKDATKINMFRCNVTQKNNEEQPFGQNQRTAPHACNL
jgi:hypothetical protein